jgi:DNA invertase Pin-like site-specific DNA recombinase
VKAGLRNVRANGVRLGRPCRIVDRSEVLRLAVEGTSLRDISRSLGIGYGTVRQRLKLVS